MKLILGLFLVFSISACKKNLINNSSENKHPLTKTFLALGDSYTSGEGMLQTESFPFQLSDKLRAPGVDMETPHVIAGTG
jgi:hypothetical protein